MANLTLRLSRRVNVMMEQLVIAPQDIGLLRKLLGFLRVADDLKLFLDLWKAQNIYFNLCCRHRELMGRMAAIDNQHLPEWRQAFKELGEALKVKGMS